MEGPEVGPIEIGPAELRAITSKTGGKTALNRTGKSRGVWIQEKNQPKMEMGEFRTLGALQNVELGTGAPTNSFSLVKLSIAGE
ncbi:MAG: hypothetical protein OXI05_01020, partial [Bacteroidota bacterium]|nr:hypothetical protein [Bacteroidota bacterium]